jgi:hypothetical protein
VDVKRRIVKIGRSAGAIIPKSRLDRGRLTAEGELETSNGSETLQPSMRARKGWNKAFRQMARCGQDKLDNDQLSPSSAGDDAEGEW